MPVKKKPVPKKTKKKPAAKAPARSMNHAQSAHPSDVALSTLLARQEQLHSDMEIALHQLNTNHPNDPALSASLARLGSLEDRLEKTHLHFEAALGKMRAQHPNDPALSTLLARLASLESRLEPLIAMVEKGGFKAPRPGAASAPAAASTAPSGGVVSVPDADTSQFLARTPLFAKLSAMECGQFAHYLEAKTLGAGEVLFKQGDFGDAMYLVKTGLLEIYKNDVFGSVRVAEVRPGGLVGEMALVENKPRSANVRASEESRLLVLSRGAYAQLKQSHPLVATKFQDELLLLISGRLRQTTEKLVGKN